MKLSRAIVLLFAAFACPLPASGDEGALEINQACATGNGCFSGDSGGFPVTISGSGRYLLTSSLDVPGDKNGVEIAAGHVNLDLNGFSIASSNSCSGTPVTSCSGATTNRGVVGTNPAEFTGNTVQNGSVTGFGIAGIALEGQSAVVRDIKVIENRTGILVINDSLVERVQARRNETDGVVTIDHSVVANSVAVGNGSNGFDIGRFAILRDSVSANNGGQGVSAGYGATIRDSSVRGNQAEGIALANSNGLIDTVVIGENAGVGVDCSTFGDSSGITASVMNDNNSGGDQFTGTCVPLGDNICEGNTACP